MLTRGLTSLDTLNCFHLHTFNSRTRLYILTEHTIVTIILQILSPRGDPIEPPEQLQIILQACKIDFSFFWKEPLLNFLCRPMQTDIKDTISVNQSRIIIVSVQVCHWCLRLNVEKNSSELAYMCSTISHF